MNLFLTFGAGKKKTNRVEVPVFRIESAATLCNNALPKPGLGCGVWGVELRV